MGGRIGRLGVNKLDVIRHRNVQQPNNVARVMLTVFVERDDPVSVRTRYAGQGCRMLAEIA